MKRVFAAVAAAGFALWGGAASATVFNDPMTFASFQFTGGFDISTDAPSDGAPLDAGDLLLFTGTVSNSMLGLQEFVGTDGFTPDLTGFELVLGLGTTNNGQTFTVDYDRSVLTAAEIATPNSAGSETGTLTFEVSATEAASASPAGAGLIDYEILGLVSITDSGGFYNPVNGSFAIAGTIGEASPSSVASFAISVPSAISHVPVPATLPLLLAALAGFGFVARRRSAA